MDRLPRDVFYIICDFLVIDIRHVSIKKKSKKTTLPYMTRKHRWIRMLAQTCKRCKLLTRDYRMRIMYMYGDDFLIIEKKLTMSKSKHTKCIKRKKLNKKKNAMILAKITPLLASISKYHLHMFLKGK